MNRLFCQSCVLVMRWGVRLTGVNVLFLRSVLKKWPLHVQREADVLQPSTVYTVIEREKRLGDFLQMIWQKLSCNIVTKHCCSSAGAPEHIQHVHIQQVDFGSDGRVGGGYGVGHRGENTEQQQQLVSWRALSVNPSLPHMNGSFRTKHDWPGVCVHVCAWVCFYVGLLSQRFERGS